MLKVPDLHTSRLTIRPLTFDDLDAARHILDSGFGAAALEERREWLEWAVRNTTALVNLHQPPYGDRAVVHRATNTLIGLIGFVPCLGPFHLLPAFRRYNEPPERLNQTEFGLFWAVAPEHRQQGYATEAAQAMIDYAFNTLRIRRIVAETDRDNLASIAVMRSLGMMVEENPTDDPPWFQVVGVLYHPESL